MPRTPPPPVKSSVDVRALNLAQLQKLAERGSRRARAELEGRMRAASAARGTRAPASTTAAPRVPAPPVRAVSTVAPLSAAAAPGGAIPPSSRQDALADQLQLIAQQDNARARVDGPPRLVGMVLIGWGALLLFGGLVMLMRGGGLYYVFCGLGAGAVGWLLLRCSRWAMALHGALLLAALVWAWAGAARHSVGMTLLQAAPLLIAALWMALRPIREPLE